MMPSPQVDTLIGFLQINTLVQPEPPSNASAENSILFKYHSKALSYPLQAAMLLMMNL